MEAITAENATSINESEADYAYNRKESRKAFYDFFENTHLTLST